MNGRTPNFEDARGAITDLLPAGDYGPPTEIRTVAGAVRGNHVHWKTTQWVYIVSGTLETACRSYDEDGEVLVRRVLLAGDMAVEPAGQAHAWKALSDCVCLVFTQGPRSGDAYESDTERLREPLIP